MTLYNIDNKEVKLYVIVDKEVDRFNIKNHFFSKPTIPEFKTYNEIL